MTTLITPAQVLRLAFGDGEYLPPESIPQADIAAAEERYIVPVIGRALYEKLLAGSNTALVDDYLAAPAALFTRLSVQPRLDIRTSQCGTAAPRASSTQPATEKALRLQRQSLLRQARTLLRRAADYLSAHRVQFPDYDPDRNPLDRCSLSGNIVQTGLRRKR